MISDSQEGHANNVPVAITLSDGTTSIAANTQKLYYILNAGSSLISDYTLADDDGDGVTDEVLGWTETTSGGVPTPSELVRLGESYYNQ